MTPPEPADFCERAREPGYAEAVGVDRLCGVE